MKQKMIQYTTPCTLQFSETENCKATISTLKKHIRKHLKLQENHCVLISCICSEHVTETVIMIESAQTMKIFKIPVTVRNISAEDIPEILTMPYTHTRMSLRKGL